MIPPATGTTDTPIMSTYSPFQIANGFLERGFRDSIPVDHMKVHKLLYLAHGYYIARTGDPLLNELFQAWKLGPVIPSVYHRLKKFGAASITEYAAVYDPKLGATVPAAAPEGDFEYEKVREFVWTNYGNRESIALSKLTHRLGGAWQQAIQANPGIQGPPMLNESIKEEFRPFVRPIEANEPVEAEAVAEPAEAGA
jgi:uncharacterized phage-associated protein